MAFTKPGKEFEEFLPVLSDRIVSAQCVVEAGAKLSPFPEEYPFAFLEEIALDESVDIGVGEARHTVIDLRDAKLERTGRFLYVGGGFVAVVVEFGQEIRMLFGSEPDGR